MKKKRKVILISFILLTLIVAIPALYINNKLSKINIKKIDKSPQSLGISDNSINKEKLNPSEEKSLEKDIKKEEVKTNTVEEKINTEKKELKVDDNTIPKEYIINILFLGIDTRNPKTDRGRNDTTIIMTLNKNNKKIKFTSILRDSLVDIAGHGKNRLGHSYAYGGCPLAIKVVNQNFNMNIRDYVKVDFFGLIKIIDSLGGVPINISEAERKSANSSITEMASIKNLPATYINRAGMQNLNGIQAVAYCRIRHVGNCDYERTSRQRKVLTELVKKFSKKSIWEIPKLADNVLPNVETSLNKTTIISLAYYALTNNISKVEEFRIPSKQKGIYYNHMSFVYIDKSVDVPKLHKFLEN